MADVKISGLPSDSSLDDTHYVPINDPTGPTTKRVLLSALKSFFNTVGTAKLDVSAPQGFLVNGQISRTVASNNITVAIKTLAGADPSATDPVYVRIGNTVRSITSALSVTKNAGTNWFSSGGTPLAAKEVDYFVYLGYNATDGVVIGFARIPHAGIYSDFSATTTNDKYCAISTITNAAATDEYEVIGRFNATLSATASFNWSVPATSVIISRPIFETRDLDITPTLTNFTIGTGGAAANTAKYKIVGRTCRFRGIMSLGTSGQSVGTGPTVALPITSAAIQTTVLVYNFAIGIDSGVWQYPLVIYSNSTTVVGFRAMGTGGTWLGSGDAVSATIPITWGAADAIAYEFSYEMA